MGQFRPLYVVVDNWIHEMITRGALHKKEAKTHRELLRPFHTATVDEGDLDRYFRTSLHHYLRPALADHFGWNGGMGDDTGECGNTGDEGDRE